jgi:hypothetical protein
MYDQTFAEFHDAHCVGWDTIISEHKLGDPEVAAADDPPHREALLVWLDGPAFLNVLPASDPFTGLRVIEHSVVVIDFMLGIEVAQVRSLPMAFQGHSHGSIIHVALRISAFVLSVDANTCRALLTIAAILVSQSALIP